MAVFVGVLFSHARAQQVVVIPVEENNSPGLYEKMKTAIKHPQSQLATQSSRTPGGAATVGNNGVPVYPRFISYPTSHRKPTLIPNANAQLAQEIHELRLQHWYFIFDQAEYVSRYGPLPTNLPGGMTPADYAAHTPIEAFNEDLERYYREQESPSQTGDSRN